MTGSETSTQQQESQFLGSYRLQGADRLIVSILCVLSYLGRSLILQVHAVLTSPPEVITSSSRACVKASQSPLIPPLGSIHLYIVDVCLYCCLLSCPSSISEAYFITFSLLTAKRLDWSSLRAASCFCHQHILIHSKLCLALRKSQDTCPAPGIIWTRQTLAGLHFTPYVRPICSSEYLLGVACCFTDRRVSHSPLT